MVASTVEKQDIKDLKVRQKKAREDRTRRAPFINEYYRLAQPQRQRIDELTDRRLTPDDLADMIDETLGETAEDFASDMIATFTPPHEPWVKHAPTKALDEAAARKVEDQIRNWKNWFWEDVSKSTYYDACYECYQDLAGGTMGICRKDYGPLSPVIYEPVPIPNLLVDQGPDCGPDGRWYETKVEKRILEANYAGKLNLPLKVRQTNDPEAKFKVCDGVHRIWSKNDDIWYRRVVFVEDELAYDKMIRGSGSASLIVARWRTDSGSAYGIGAAWRASAYQRVLNEVTALNLAGMHKLVDPAYAYSGDGTANLDGGIDAGEWIDLGENFKVERLGGDERYDVTFFTKDDLQAAIRRALFQDKPEQRGKTPPTREQWVDERQMAQQRFEIPRGKIYREWVVPIVQAHMWLRAQHGRMPPIMLNNEAINLEPLSPQARARAFDEVAKAQQILALAFQYMPQESQIAIDAKKTIQRIKDMLSDDLVALRTDEEIAQQIAQLMQQGALAGGDGKGVPAPNGQALAA